MIFRTISSKTIFRITEIRHKIQKSVNSYAQNSKPIPSFIYDLC